MARARQEFLDLASNVSVAGPWDMVGRIELDDLCVGDVLGEVTPPLNGNKSVSRAVQYQRGHVDQGQGGSKVGSNRYPPDASGRGDTRAPMAGSVPP